MNWLRRAILGVAVVGACLSPAIVAVPVASASPVHPADAWSACPPIDGGSGSVNTQACQSIIQGYDSDAGYDLCNFQGIGNPNDSACLYPEPLETVATAWYTEPPQYQPITPEFPDAIIHSVINDRDQNMYFFTCQPSSPALWNACLFSAIPGLYAYSNFDPQNVPTPWIELVA